MALFGCAGWYVMALFGRWWVYMGFIRKGRGNPPLIFFYNCLAQLTMALHGVNVNSAWGIRSTIKLPNQPLYLRLS